MACDGIVERLSAILYWSNPNHPVGFADTPPYERRGGENMISRLYEIRGDFGVPQVSRRD